MRNHVAVVPDDKLISVDGEPLRFVFAAPANLHALQWRNGAGHLEITGELNRLLEGEAAYLAEVAPYVALWEAEQESRKPVPPTLEEARANALAQLRAKRKQVEYGGFTFEGQLWDSEEKDELRLNSMLKIFELTGAPEIPGWKIHENVYITLTPQQAALAAVALAQHYSRVFSVEQVKAGEIEQLTSVEAITTWLQTELNEGWVA